MAKRVLPATEQRFQAAKIKNASPNIIPSIDSNHKVKSRSRSMPPAPLVVKKPAQAHSNQLPVVTSKDDDTFSVASTGIAPSVHTINSTATSKASAQSKIKTVKKLRPDPALLVSSGTSIRQACILMAAKRSDCVLIISDEGSLLSIATDKDVVRGFAEHDDHQWPDITSIDAIATHNPTCVQATDEAMSSISLMVTKRWRHLPVLEDETVVGVLCIQRCLTEAIERAQKKIGKTQWSSLKQLEAVDPTLAKALSPLLTDVRTLRNLLAEETSQQQVVTPETNVFEATRLMASGRRAVAVVRSDRGLEDLGILTPKDVVTRVIAKNLDPRATIVESVETPDADTADADATCLDCLGQMHDGAYLNCPVVDRNTKTVLGVVEVMALVEGISTNEDMAVGTYNDNYETSSVTSMQPRDSTMNKSTVAKLRPDLNVLKFTPGTMLNQVCAEMTSKRTDVALVVEDSRNFCGLVTDHDIAFKVVAENLDLQKTSVDAIMSPAPACVSSTDGAVDALKQMVKHKIRHLPVLVDGTVAGVLHVRKCLNDAIEKIEVLERKKKKTESSDNDDLASIISTALGTKNKDMNALLGPLMASLSGQQAKTVASLLSSDKESCIVAASTSVLEAAQRMRATRKAVISTNDQGRIIGILTPRDVLMRCVANNMDVVNTKVADIHTAHPETALSTTTLLEAMQKMHDGGFLHLPVVDDTTIIGVVDVINIAYATMGDDHAEEGWSTLMLLDNDQSSVVDDCGSIIARPVPAAQSCGKTVDQLRPDHKPVTALTDEMIIDVCQKMVKRRSDCCLILGSGSESVILGLVTDSDVTRRALAKRVNIETTAISEIMTANPTCVEATSSALDALQLMINSRFRHLPVTATQGTGPAVLHINRCLYAAITLLEQLADRAKKQAHADKQRIAETVLEVVKSGKTVGTAAVIAPLLESLTSDKAATVSTLLEAEDRSNCILESTASVRTATQVMTQTRQAIAAVDCEGRLVGILSPNDILVRVAAVSKDPDETSIAEVMTTNPQRTTPTATLFSVLEQMHDGRFLTCPVVDGNSVRAVIDVIEVAYATIGGGNNLDEQQAWSALMLSTGDDGSETASVRSAEIAAENIEKTVADLRPERRPVVVSCSTSIAELCSLMLKRRTDCALVTNDASLSGIVTDTDIARKVVAERLHPHLTVVECIMTPKPACVLGTDSALDSLKLMVSNRFRHLPVLDRVNGKIVGILNIHRCLYAAIEKLEKLESALKENNNKQQDQQAALAAVLQVAVNASSHRSKSVDPNQLAKMLGPLLDSLDGQKRVGDAIVKNSVTAVVSALAPVRRAAEIMATTRCAVLAIDEETGAVVGILSPKDIAHRVVARDLDPDSTSVEEVFTPDPDTINADASLLEALQMMSDRHYGHLPVVDAQGEVAGVVDVMGMLHATMQGSDGWSTLMATSVGDDQDDDTASQLSFVTPSRQRHRGLRGREDDRLSTTSFDHRGLDNLESQYTYKIIDKRTGHLHRVQASDENFTQVTQSVVKRLQVSAVHLTYQDEDGDDVVLTDDHSLVDAVAYARSSGRPLKLNATIPSKSSEDLNATATSFLVSPIMEKSANSSRRPPPPPANNNAILYISIAALLAIVCVASLSSSSRAH
uniref:CBS domain-containing protein n=1 Tax=Aureoumbra lagunensis TaxID=44058 RepID=A0A7S3NIV0_9STRA